VPKEPTLDWISLRHLNVFKMTAEEAAEADRNLAIIKQYASYELFVLKTTFVYRLPEFSEQEAMMGPSPRGFFEDTPENGVGLFRHIFKDNGFSIQNLEGVPIALKAGVIDQYYTRSRTALDYCSEVWLRHEYAKAELNSQKERIKEQKFARFLIKKKGLPASQAEPNQTTSYSELMQGLAYTPAMKDKEPDFISKCEKLISSHRVTLRMPQVIKEDNYDVFTQRLRDALQRTVQLAAGTRSSLQGTLRKLAENAKRTARLCIKNQACRALRRVVAAHIPAMYPACFHALEGLPVTVTVFDEVKVSFALHFGDQYRKRRTLYVNDFSRVNSTVSWLEHQMKALDALSALQTEKYRINKEPKESLEDIKKGSAQGKAGFEKALSDLRRLLNDN